MHITRQAWRKVPGGSRRGKLIWGIQLYFPRTAIQRQGVEEGGMQGKAAVIGLLPHTGAGSIFGRKKGRGTRPFIVPSAL